MGKTVEIGLAANGPYFCGLLETACSMAMHANKEYALRFHVLDAGIAEEDKSYVTAKIAEFHPHCVFEWIPVEEKMFEGLPKWNGGYMVYTRLLLPQLLKDIDWCIYCDCDFTWMRDIAELWELREDQYSLISVKDGTKYMLDEEEEWFVKHGFSIDRERYFCAGLTFFNLKKFREEEIDKKCFELLQLHPPYNDQSVLNILCHDSTKLVPQIWQRLTEAVTADEYENGVVIHHAGEVPWKKMPRVISLLSDTRLIWHKMNAKIRGISTWASLRTYFSVGEILYHRALVYIIRCPGIRQVLKWGLCAINHPGVWNLLDIRSRKVSI